LTVVSPPACPHPVSFPGLNEHPLAHEELTIRQVEAPIKIYKSRWVPASLNTTSLSLMKKHRLNIKLLKKFEFFLDLCIDLGVQGTNWELLGPILKVKNIKRSSFFKHRVLPCLTLPKTRTNTLIPNPTTISKMQVF